MKTGKASSTSFLSRDEIDAVTHPWYVPGVNGAVLDAALVELANASQPCRLVVDKRRNDTGAFTFTVKIEPL